MYMFAAETRKERTVNYRNADVVSSLSDIAGAAGRDTAQWQYVRFTAREVCYSCCVCSRASSVLLRC